MLLSVLFTGCGGDNSKIPDGYYIEDIDCGSYSVFIFSGNNLTLKRGMKFLKGGRTPEETVFHGNYEIKDGILYFQDKEYEFSYGKDRGRNKLYLYSHPRKKSLYDGPKYILIKR